MVKRTAAVGDQGDDVTVIAATAPQLLIGAVAGIVAAIVISSIRRSKSSSTSQG